MRYVADHDFHIHSTVSACCRDENQTPDAILEYAKKNNFKSICLTNHFWDGKVKSDAEWHDAHTYERLVSVLPLPRENGIEFLFGAETDMDYNNVLGVADETFDEFDFVTVATTHLHLTGNTVRTEISTPEEAAFHWLDKIENLLTKNLPWHKIGIAHLTCGHIFKKRTAEVISLLTDDNLRSVFSECSDRGLGIELNMKTIYTDEKEKEIMLRPYFIAKECGCKFYLGSDAHKTEALKSSKENFENIITLLDLKESDKFVL